jgi:hypothetical protein
MVKLKRKRAGIYQYRHYYVERFYQAVRHGGTGIPYWMVGFTTFEGSHHLEDFQSLKEARQYLTERGDK